MDEPLSNSKNLDGGDNLKINYLPITADLPFVVDKDEKIVYYAKPDKNIYIHNLSNSSFYSIFVPLMVLFVISLIGLFLVFGINDLIINLLLVAELIIFILISLVSYMLGKKGAEMGYPNQNYWITTKRVIRQIGLTTLSAQPLDITPIDTISGIETRDLHLSKFFQEGWSVIARPIAFTGYMSSTGVAYGDQSIIKIFPHFSEEGANEFAKYLKYERDLNNPNAKNSQNNSNTN